MSRKLAYIVEIDDIVEHTNADSLEIAVVGGWQVIIRKGEFKAEDTAVYFEIDSWIPTELAPFLSKGKEPKEYNSIKGEKLRTVKLRGELSQGLLLPVSAKYSLLPIGTDLTKELNIQKWEKDLPTKLAGSTKGNYPSVFPKTDQTRIQNMNKELQNGFEGFFVTQEKLEGSSMTCYLKAGEFGVCSRNLDLKKDENNSFWKTALELDIETKMRNYFGDNACVAVQGELIGEGVQGNIYKLKGLEFHVFDIYEPNSKGYQYNQIVEKFCSDSNLKMVPILERKVSLEDWDMKDFLTYAEGKSKLNPSQEREGVVFKSLKEPNFTFKVISNKYLLNEK